MGAYENIWPHTHNVVGKRSILIDFSENCDYSLVVYQNLTSGNFFFFFFLRLHLWHVEVLGPGVELELQLLVYTTATATSNLRPHLRPMLQLAAATPDPQPTKVRD